MFLVFRQIDQSKLSLFGYSLLGFAHNLCPFNLGNGVIRLYPLNDLYLGNSSVVDRVVTDTSRVLFVLQGK